MGIFHRKSKWEQLIEQIAALGSGSSVKSGLTAAAGLIGVTAVSSAVSSWRRKHES